MTMRQLGQQISVIHSGGLFSSNFAEDLTLDDNMRKYWSPYDWIFPKYVVGVNLENIWKEEILLNNKGRIALTGKRIIIYIPASEKLNGLTLIWSRRGKKEVETSQKKKETWGRLNSSKWNAEKFLANKKHSTRETSGSIRRRIAFPSDISNFQNRFSEQMNFGSAPLGVHIKKLSIISGSFTFFANTFDGKYSLKAAECRKARRRGFNVAVISILYKSGQFSTLYWFIFIFYKHTIWISVWFIYSFFEKL